MNLILFLYLILPYFRTEKVQNIWKKKKTFYVILETACIMSNLALELLQEIWREPHSQRTRAMIAFEGKNRRIDLNVSLQNFPRTHKVSRESMKNQADLRFGLLFYLWDLF